MRRRLLNVASRISLVLLVATIALMLRSLFVGDELFVSVSRGVVWDAFSGYGTFSVQRFSGWPDPPGISYRTLRVVGTDTGETPMWWPANATQIDLRAIRIEHGLERVTIRKGGTHADWGHGPPIGTGGEESWDWSAPSRYFSVEIPYWAAAVLFGMMPVLAMVKKIRQNIKKIRQNARQRAGRCSRCGYDLRATPDRCPECGTPVAEGTMRHQ